MVHDLFRPLNDLKEIKVSLGSKCPTTTDLIDSKIKEYESDIDAVDEYLKNDKTNGLSEGQPS
jgi:hypothetical protein